MRRKYRLLGKTIISAIILSLFSINIAFAAQAPLKIEVKIEKYPDLKRKLVQFAKEMEQIAKLYKTSNQTAYWETEGKNNFLSLLASEGYYSAAIDIELSKNTENKLIFYIVPWERYKLNKIIVKHADKSNLAVKLPENSQLKLEKGQYVVASEVIDAQEKILKILEKENCLLSLSASHMATINHFDDTIDITYIIEAGPFATIERIDYKGLQEVEAEYVDKLIGLENGQCFKQTYINEARGDLQKSGLFAFTNPDIPKEVNENGSVPIVFNLKERKFRSIKAGVSYGTDLGIGLNFGWEHRNFFGHGENVNIDSFLNMSEQMVDMNYVKPFFNDKNQKLILNSKFENQKTRAFIGQEGSVSALIEKDFYQNWSSGFGGKISQSRIKSKSKEGGKIQLYSFLSAPLFLKYDTRSNILNPKDGHDLSMYAEPFFSVRSKEMKPFLKAQVSLSKYFAFKTKFKPVLAVRASYGTTLGTKAVRIPPNERFYVGGGQSLRGYEYQLAGDLENGKVPIGGRSFVETSVELRLNVTKEIGLVGFLDSGRSYRSLTPKLSSELFHGVGFGVRYMTDFGPIRADIGFPLKKRRGVDNNFQLYFGIGQSF